MKPKDYLFINKTLFFPKQGILVVGDLHLGFDYKIQQSGVLVPEMQVEEIKEELKQIFKKLENRKLKLKKLIFLGDIKHSFSYKYAEKNYFNELLKFLRKYIEDKNIILIRGNHDTIDYSFSDRLTPYFIKDGLAFIHGHRYFPEIFEQKVKTIIMGHIHPSIVLSDKPNIKREKYKCFLTGKFQKKEVIILPSFLATTEGATINSLDDEYKDSFSIIPKKDLTNFKVNVVGEDEPYDFGKVKYLINKD